MCVFLNSCKQFLISYTQALSQVSEDVLTIPVICQFGNREVIILRIAICNSILIWRQRNFACQ